MLPLDLAAGARQARLEVPKYKALLLLGGSCTICSTAFNYSPRHEWPGTIGSSCDRRWVVRSEVRVCSHTRQFAWISRGSRAVSSRPCDRYADRRISRLRLTRSPWPSCSLTVEQRGWGILRRSSSLSHASRLCSTRRSAVSPCAAKPWRSRSIEPGSANEHLQRFWLTPSGCSSAGAAPLCAIGGARRTKVLLEEVYVAIRNSYHAYFHAPKLR